ncbi:MAG TPA: DNA recombination protein RmuC [candidate division Zixibacteria bacterium]|nr:DNA recombination protein RmuC [candidate division Zixibacteria bacterium]
MSPTTLVLFALLGAALLVTLTWLVIQSRRKDEKSSAESIQAAFQTLTAELVQKQMDGMLALRNSLDQANKILNDRLAESTKSLDKRVEVFGEIKSQIGELAVQAKNIENIGQNIQSLSELLKPPKLRGNVGETFLENMLSQILPKALYELQHSFPSGQRVDAVIKFGDRLFSIDSKFPLEAFNKHMENPDKSEYRKLFTQSIKKHVDDICSRYIIPQEGTLEFAIMYIPAESIYYQLISNESEMFSYALSKKVIPSSPGHLYGYLATMSAVYRETGLMNQGRQLTAFINKLSDSLQKLSGLHERMDGSVRALTLSLNKARDETRNAEQHLGRIQKPDEEQPQIARQIDYLIDNSNTN